MAVILSGTSDSLDIGGFKPLRLQVSCDGSSKKLFSQSTPLSSSSAFG